MSGQQEIQRMVEKELVHAIEAVLNTTKKSKRSPSVNTANNWRISKANLKFLGHNFILSFPK